MAVGLLVFGWLLNTPGGILGKADAIGYAVCHRIDLRSFHLGQRAIPLCARCTGMYLGAFLGLLYQAVISPRRTGTPPLRVILVLGAMVVAFGLDGLNSFMSLFPEAPTLYQPHNWSRLFTGTGMGLAIAAGLYPAFNQTLWKTWDSRPALGGLKALGWLVGLAVVLDILVLSENPFILYPAALLSAAGVLVLLTLVYSMLLLILFRAENKLLNWGQALLPLVGGFGLGLLQIIVLDSVRYVLTGTWAGFHLG